MTIFLAKSSIILRQLTQIFFFNISNFSYVYLNGGMDFVVDQFCEIFDPKKKYDNKFFFHPCLFIALLDPGWVKIRIRDKHPGSATLLPFIVISIVYTRHFMLCCGSGMLIPDLEFFASRICDTGSCNEQKGGGGGIDVLPFCGLK